MVILPASGTRGGNSPQSGSRLSRWLGILRERELLRTSAWGLCDQATISASNFVTMVMLARTVSPTEFGWFTVVYAENGSTDASYDIAAGHAAEDPRVRVLRLERAGVVGALNAALDAARCDWVARVDADDVALPNLLERQHAFLGENPDVALLGTHAYYVGNTGRIMGVCRRGPTTREEFARLRDRGLMIMMSSSVVFSRSVARAVGGFREEYSIVEDADLWTRIADRHLVLTLPEPLAYYRIHEASTSTRRLRDQALGGDWCWANTLRRRAGQPEISWAEFSAARRRHPWYTRVRDELEVHSLAHYRRGGTLLGRGNPAGLGHLLLSAAMWPPIPLHRLGHQKAVSTVAAAMAARLSRIGRL